MSRKKATECGDNERENYSFYCYRKRNSLLFVGKLWENVSPEFSIDCNYKWHHSVINAAGGVLESDGGNASHLWWTRTESQSTLIIFLMEDPLPTRSLPCCCLLGYRKTHQNIIETFWNIPEIPLSPLGATNKAVEWRINTSISHFSLQLSIQNRKLTEN